MLGKAVNNSGVQSSMHTYTNNFFFTNDTQLQFYNYIDVIKVVVSLPAITINVRHM